MSDKDIFWDKAFQILDTSPLIGTIYSMPRAVWFGFHGNSKEPARTCINLFQGVVCDAVVTIDDTEPLIVPLVHSTADIASNVAIKESFHWLQNKNNRENLMSNMKKVHNKHKIDQGTHQYICVIHDTNMKFKDDMERCFDDMWHSISLFNSVSYSGKISYLPYIKNGMIVVSFIHGLINGSPVGLHIHWDSLASKLNVNGIGTLKYNNNNVQSLTMFEGEKEYYFTGSFKPLELGNSMILKYGILSINMLNMKNESCALADLYTDLAGNMVYLESEGKNGKVMVPSVNKNGEKLIFNDRNKVDKADTLFYLDFVSKRIVHIRTRLVLEANKKASYSEITLKPFNQSADRRILQEWDFVVSDKRFYLKADHNLVLDSNGSSDFLILYINYPDSSFQQWELHQDWNLQFAN
ncbi:hypothetical protein F8M41_021407 [Gigaspora margarita]|uniref:Uncharacterized protein n=1 Tax=Gigaspora margarita TaxID=4874 RepID=A0A8H4EIX8_GIGMA|nr:hypothetical protein F8M41_021407 [Gigaspora margarita]